MEYNPNFYTNLTLMFKDGFLFLKKKRGGGENKKENSKKTIPIQN